MAYEDIEGLPYAQIRDLKAGRTVWLDSGFTCHDAGPVTLFLSPDGLWFKCTDGRHYLEGQCDDEHGICVGVYASSPSGRSEGPRA